MSKADRTKQFIIEKAAPIFNTKGIAATAVSDIMQATEMGKGSLYVHFQNKEDLAYCAVDWNLQTFVDLVSTEARKFTGAKNQLFAMLDYLSDPLNPPVKGGCPMLNFGMEADDTNPVIREKVHQTVCTIQQSIIDILEAGVISGEISPEWNYREFAVKAYAMFEGGILISRVSQDITQMKLLMGILKSEIEANCT